MTPEMQWLVDSIDNGTTDFIFGAIVLLLFAAAVTVLLFVCLAIRAAWRWITRATCGNVIVYTERKALRSR